MIDRDHQLPITRQAQLLGMSRGAVYFLPRPVSQADLALTRERPRCGCVRTGWKADRWVASMKDTVREQRAAFI